VEWPESFYALRRGEGGPMCLVPRYADEPAAAAARIRSTNSVFASV
jgi:hypothetical protein